MEVQPSEGRDGLGVVVQVGDVALGGRDGHVEDQPLLRRLVVLGVQGGRGQRGEDELVHLQDEGGHEGGLGRLVLHRTVDQNRQPHRLCLGAGQRDGKVKGKDKGLISDLHGSLNLNSFPLFSPICVNLHLFWDAHVCLTQHIARRNQHILPQLLLLYVVLKSRQAMSQNRQSDVLELTGVCNKDTLFMC